jgi:hypothetical protein
MTTDTPPAHDVEERPLGDDLRRALFFLVRAPRFEEVGLLALRTDERSLTTALLALPLGLPFWAAGVLPGDLVQGLLHNPVQLVSGGLAYYLVGSLSPLAWCGAVAALMGQPKRFFRCGTALLIWGAGSMLFRCPATLLDAWDVLPSAIQDGVDLAFTVWVASVSTWIIGRTLGVPVLLAGAIFFVDLLASDLLALFLLTP